MFKLMTTYYITLLSVVSILKCVETTMFVKQNALYINMYLGGTYSSYLPT